MFYFLNKLVILKKDFDMRTCGRNHDRVSFSERTWESHGGCPFCFLIEDLMRLRKQLDIAAYDNHQMRIKARALEKYEIAYRVAREQEKRRE